MPCCFKKIIRQYTKSDCCLLSLFQMKRKRRNICRRRQRILRELRMRWKSTSWWKNRKAAIVYLFLFYVKVIDREISWMPNTVISEISFSYCVWNVISPLKDMQRAICWVEWITITKYILREDISYTIPFEVKKEKHVEIYNIRGTTENYPVVRKVG